MEFKDGDRVRVLRAGWEDVELYATLRKGYSSIKYFLMVDTSISVYEECLLLRPDNQYFGVNKRDFYVLAEDEEDTEAPVIQHSTDPVNHPDHYNYGEIEIIDFIDQVSEHYNPVVAVHIANAIKYLSRAPHKNGKEDIEKARWYIERAYQKWSD